MERQMQERRQGMIYGTTVKMRDPDEMDEYYEQRAEAMRERQLEEAAERGEKHDK